MINDEPEIRFFVPGIPQPAGSKKAFVIPGTNRATVVDDAKKSRPWKSLITTVAVQHYAGEPLTGALCLTLWFTVLRPKGHYGTGKNADKLRASARTYPTVKPDCTKTLRAVEDALTGVCWVDDVQIVDQHAFKRYGRTPGVLIEIRKMEDVTS